MKIASLVNDINIKSTMVATIYCSSTATLSEMLNNSNARKGHYVRVQALEKGNEFSLINGQCTQMFVFMMKQGKLWVALSAPCKQLQLYKLIKRVLLKQAKDLSPCTAI